MGKRSLYSTTHRSKYHGRHCGKSVTTILRPGAGELRLGTPTSSGKSIPKTMRLLGARETIRQGLKKKFVKWIAGHLLNADLGGYGDDDENLVPLTSRANRNHSTFENLVKRMAVGARWIQAKRPDRYLGVRYSVIASDNALQTTGDLADVPSTLELAAEVVQFKLMRDSSNPGEDKYEETAMEDDDLKLLKRNKLDGLRTRTVHNTPHFD